MTTRRRTLARALAVAAAAASLSVPVAARPAAAQPEPPPPLPARPIRFPAFETFTLENGLRVAVIPYGTQPVVSARLYARGGGWSADPPGKAGLARLAATVVTRGTATRSAPEISELIEGVGGSLTANAGQEFFNVGTTVLVDHVELGFELLADVIRNATFPEEEVELARRQMLSALQADLGDAEAVATRVFEAVIYGEDHPYGQSATVAAAQGLTRDDLIAFRDRVLIPDGAILIVAGRLDRARVEALVRGHFGDWTGGERVVPEVPEPRERTETEIYLVHRPGSVQSVVIAGNLGISAASQDYFPLVVATQVLGGNEGRLMDILREERGWTYGAYATFNRPSRRGRFLAQAEVRTEVTDSAVAEILTQLRRLGEEPVPDAELEEAISYLAGSFPLRMETADQVAGQLSGPLLLGLPLEDVTEYPEKVRAITREDVQRVAREYMRPDRVAIVVVGDAAALHERLAAIAPVRLLDVEGNPLAPEQLAPAGGPE